MPLKKYPVMMPILAPIHQPTQPKTIIPRKMHSLFIYSLLEWQTQRIPCQERPNVKSVTLVQRQLNNVDDSVLIIFQITTYIFFSLSNFPSSSSLPPEKLLLNPRPGPVLQNQTFLSCPPSHVRPRLRVPLCVQKM